MEGKMSLRVAYVAIWIITGLIALCSEKGILPVEYLPHDPNTDYAVGVVSFFTAIGGTYLALRLLAFKTFVRKMTGMDEVGARMVYKKWCFARLAVIAVAMWVNVLLYYATSYADSVKYCLLIVMIAAVFCWPSEGEFNSKRNRAGKSEEASEK